MWYFLNQIVLHITKWRNTSGNTMKKNSFGAKIAILRGIFKIYLTANSVEHRFSWVESSDCDRFRLLHLVCLYRCVMLEIKRVNSKPGGVLVKDDVIQWVTQPFCLLCFRDLLASRLKFIFLHSIATLCTIWD